MSRYDEEDDLESLRDDVTLPPMMPPGQMKSLQKPPTYEVPPAFTLFPEFIEPGFYDKNGNRVAGLDADLNHLSPHQRERIRAVIEFAGVTFVWGVFGELLGPHQKGEMTFKNVPGMGPLTPFFGEWDPVACAPRVGEASFQLIAVQQGRNTARIVGRNGSRARLPAVAGFIVSQNVEMPWGKGPERVAAGPDYDEEEPDDYDDEEYDDDLD